MSYYYKYNFVSPEPAFATITEEFKSYFDTGAVDNLMFPTYANKCLLKLGKASYSIRDEVLHIEDFECRLPDNFYSVREAWLCTEVNGYPYQNANSFYSQASDQTTIQVSPVTTNGQGCTNLDCNEGIDGECMPELIQAVYKTNNEHSVTYKKSYLLKPGNISVKANCALDCKNFGSSSVDSFDIRDNKFVTNFRHGKVYLLFYATDYDESGNQLIPDNFRIREYIEAYIRWKLMETLFNQINDETSNQIQQKMQYYKQLHDEALIMAFNEIKSQDVYAKQRRIQQDLSRNRMYELPNYSSGRRYGSEWNRNY
jgi:hypothetical protein